MKIRSSFFPKTLALFFFGFCLLQPVGVFAQTANTQSANALSYSATKLPFLHEASSGTPVEIIRGQISYVGGGNGTGSNIGGNNGNGLVGNTAIGGSNSRCAFKDIKGHSSEQAIQYLYDKKVVNGRKSCYFYPNAEATRAEAAAMAARAVKLSIPAGVSEKPFSDVKKESWAAPSVTTAKINNIVHGYPDKLYRPDQGVNKVEALKIVTRAFNSDFSHLDFDQLDNFTDIGKDQWYMQYLQAGVNEGLVDAKNKLVNPAKILTRAQLSEMIYTLLKRREG